MFALILFISAKKISPVRKGLPVLNQYQAADLLYLPCLNFHNAKFLGQDLPVCKPRTGLQPGSYNLKG